MSAAAKERDSSFGMGRENRTGCFWMRSMLRSVLLDFSTEGYDDIVDSSVFVPSLVTSDGRYFQKRVS
jgi:hypothetical protein